MKKKPSANLIVGPNECGASHTLIARIEYYNIPLISNHPALCGDLLCNKHVMFNILLSITTGHSILMLTIATSYYRHAVRCIRNFYFKSSTIIYYIILRFLRLLYSYIFYIPLQIIPIIIIIILLLYVAYSMWPRKTSSCIYNIRVLQQYLHEHDVCGYFTMTTTQSYMMRSAISLNIQLSIISYMETKTKLYYYLLFILCYDTYSYPIMARVCMLHVLCAIIIMYTILS